MSAPLLDLVDHVGIDVKTGVVGIVNEVFRFKAKVHKLSGTKVVCGIIPIGEAEAVA